MLTPVYPSAASSPLLPGEVPSPSPPLSLHPARPAPHSPPSPSSSDSESDSGSGHSRSSVVTTAVVVLSPFVPSPLLPPPHVSRLPGPPSLPTLTGRTHQRYCGHHRLICGAIPFRLSASSSSPSSPPSVSLLALRSLPSAESGADWIFPKGGWESFESETECALREVMEEAGVAGRLVAALGETETRSGKGKVGRLWMWALQVEREFDDWNDRSSRERRWMTMREAKAAVSRDEMREMLSRMEAALRQLGISTDGDQQQQQQGQRREERDGSNEGSGAAAAAAAAAR